jgi:hypothetical protein
VTQWAAINELRDGACVRLHYRNSCYFFPEPINLGKSFTRVELLD